MKRSLRRIDSGNSNLNSYKPNEININKLINKENKVK